ncbi:MAG: BMP family ABC transporter substrate-binding protein [Anaerolineae bacterium]|nr:BMP family ABC transporter substrate-binding protein [Anaerolineae bacterium]
MNKKHWMLAVSLIVLSLVATACGGTAEKASDELFKVASVYVGPVGNLGWSYAHDLGRQAVEDDLDYVETTFIELVSEDPDAERVIRDYAEQGYDMIFATSYGYMDSVLAVAEEYPDVRFGHCTGYLTADNVAICDGSGYEGWYLVWITAGRLSATSWATSHPAPFQR